MGHPIDDAIANAGAQLQRMWRNPAHQIPSADLNPRTDALQFQIQVLANRCDALEKTMTDLINSLRQRPVAR